MQESNIEHKSEPEATSSGFESEILNPEQKMACNKIIHTLVSNSDSIDTALLSSPDGLLLAGAGIDTELDVIAAMSSSLLSLSDAISSRSDGGTCDKVFCESNDSLIVVVHAAELILTLMGKPQSNMGMVLAQAKATSKKITATVQLKPFEA